MRVFGCCLLVAAIAAQAGPTKASTNAPARNGFTAETVGEIPQSTYEVPISFQEGRNPFFPNSPMGEASSPIVKTNEQKRLETIPSDIVLNGLTSPPRPTAMINGRTFEPGEEGEVKLPGGHRVRIKCDEIKDTSAIIIVGGVRHELKLRFAL